MKKQLSDTSHARKQKKPLACELCMRRLALTFHHLIPKKMHRRTFFRKNYSREELNQGVYLCRACHSGLHKLYDEMTLAKQFNTLAQLKKDERIRSHSEWVAKQKRL